MSGVIDHANVQVKIDSKLLSSLDLSTPDDSLLYQILSTLSNGTGANQASQQWSDTRTVTTGATDSLDLAGSLTNAFGVTLTFTKIKVLLVKAATNNSTTLQVTRPASNGVVLFLAAGDAIVLQAGAWLLWFDPNGIAVTAGTGDLLNIVNTAGNSANYDIVIIGTD